MLKAKLLAGGGTETLYSDDVFSAYTYTGNGSTQTITNGIDLAGKGGLVWSKQRNGTGTHNISDTVRGISREIHSETTSGQGSSEPQHITSVTSSGYVLGNDGAPNAPNVNTQTYVSWTFRKAPKFFDVVTYAGAVGTQNIAHSLGVQPGMIIIKQTNAAGQNWRVWHRSLSTPADEALALNLTSSKGGGSGSYWNYTEPTASVFTVGTDESVNASGSSYVAYLFAHDTDTGNGIVQCGSFTTDGAGAIPTQTLGWEPQYLMYKRTNGVGDWIIDDQMRGWKYSSSNEAIILANTSAAETTQNVCVPSATGFGSVGSAGGALPASSTYIYLAIRRPNKPPTTGSQVYNAIARTGTGAAATVTGVGFAPDLVIPDRRSSGDTNWWDRLRGFPALWSHSTAAESTPTAGTGLTAYGMDGVSFGTNWNGENASAAPIINWFFKRATGVFDVVCYTGTGTNTTVAHNLGVAPELMIVKSRNTAATNWIVYHSALGNTYYQNLNYDFSTSGPDSDVWSSTTPTASQFSVGNFNNTNGSTRTFVAYLFATKAGISKVGDYTGNGAAAGSTGGSQTINCGFATGARFILIKCTSHTGDWIVWDTVRGIVAEADPKLFLNNTAAENATEDEIDPDSTGFIVNQLGTGHQINALGRAYIYLAFA